MLYDEYKNPLYPSAAAKPAGQWPALAPTYLQSRLSERVYR